MIPTPKHLRTNNADKCWSLKQTGKSAELMIYGIIDDSNYWGDEITPKEVDAALKAMGEVDEIIIRINSPGGSTTSGMAMYTMLNRHPAEKTTYIDGVAASMASIIALVSKKVIMAKGTLMMIHNPSGSIYGATAQQMRQRAELLDKVCGQMIDIYSEKTGLTAEEIQPMLDATTWLTAEEAIKMGFAHELESSLQMTACMRGDVAIINGIEMNLSHFANAPKFEEVLPADPPVPPEETEQPNYEPPTEPNGDEIEAKQALQAKISARQRELDLNYRRF